MNNSYLKTYEKDIKIQTLTLFGRGFDYIKSPLNYIGGKYKLLKQITPLFPENIDTFVDLFAGGCNVGINVHSKKVIFNDNLTYLIEMYEKFLELEIDEILEHIESRINQFQLSLQNEVGYREMRDAYNKDKHPIDLFVLVAYSFNHQIRFNSDHKFNNPFGRERSSFNPKMRTNLINFLERIKKIDTTFTNINFVDFDYSELSKNDFVYCDPPYLITTGTYNDGKRGFNGWGANEEISLLQMLDALDKKGVRFALSNVLEHKGKRNDLLYDWVKKSSQYHVIHLDYNYSNSNYQTLNRIATSSVEVLITNYNPEVKSSIRFIKI